MRHRTKQWLAGLLPVVMVLSMLPVTAMADSAAPPEDTVPAVRQETSPDEEIPSDEEASPDEEIPSDEGIPLDEEISPDEETSSDGEAGPEGEPGPDGEEIADAEDGRPSDGEEAPAGDLPADGGEGAPMDAAADLPEGEELSDEPLPIANSGNSNGFDWTLDDRGTLAITGSGEMNIASGSGHEVSVPWDRDAVETVIIRGDVTAIGDRAFSEHWSLRRITLPESLTSIGERAFDQCDRMLLTELPTGVTTIKAGAFAGCYSLALTELPAGLTVIEKSAFSSCGSMALTALPAGVTSIGDEAFEGCDSLALTEIPEGVTSIGNFAFLTCEGLTHLTLPASLASMGYYVFQSCDNLTTLTFLGMTAPTIDPLAFGNAHALRDIFIPEGAKGYEGSGWPQEKVHTGHNVAVGSADNGTAHAAPDFAGEGTQIVLTAVPDEGYHLERWETVPTLTVTENSFTMPGQDVTVTPVFAPHVFGGWERNSSSHWRACVCGVRDGEGAHEYTGGVCSVCGYIDECDIFVKVLTGGHVALRVRSTDTVRSVKEQLEASQGIPAAIQRLSFSGVPLEDDQLLWDQGVRKDSTLHLALSYTAGGTGTADDPYRIENEQQLIGLRYIIGLAGGDGGVGNTYRLEADIALTGPWTPIGPDAGSPFRGVFDGGGHTVSGLNAVGGAGQLGLFGYIDGGTVKDLTVEGAFSADGGENAGAIAGYNRGGSIENCVNAADITGNGSLGGIVGVNDGGTVTGCRNTGAITGEDGYVGGIVGAGEYGASGTISGCSNAGRVSATANSWTTYVGGIIGDDAYETVVGCANTGEVVGAGAAQVFAGGIAGNGFGVIQSCRNSGAVTSITESAYSGAGGIIGWEKTNVVHDQVVGCFNTGAVRSNRSAGGIAGSGNNIKNCGNTGDVTGEYAGGIAGGLEGSFILSGCYNVGQIAAEGGSAGGILGGPGGTENCYYLDTCGADGEGTPKTYWEFTSGQVAYLLQGGQDVQEPLTWGQDLSGDAPDKYPVLTGDGSKRAYQITFLADWEPDYAAKLYVNPGKAVGTVPEMPRAEGYVPVKWSLTDSAEGEPFTASTVVNGDMTVYAIHEKCGGLTVSVAVAGEGADPDREWRFRVEVDDPYYYGDGDLSFADGKAEFTLKAGQSRTIANLTPGTAYTVTELNGDRDGYDTACTDDRGVIVSGETMTAAFTNAFTAGEPEDDPGDEPKDPDTPDKPSEDDPEDPPEDPDTPDKPSEDDPGDEPEDPDVPDEPAEDDPEDPPEDPDTPDKPAEDDPDDEPETGDESHPAFWLWLLVLSLTGMAATALTWVVSGKRSANVSGTHLKK